MTILLASAIDATVILAITLLVTTAMKRRSASLRHSVLAAGLAAAAIAPVLELLVPQVAILDWIVTSQIVSSGVTLMSNPATGDPDGWIVSSARNAFVSWPSVLLTIWAVGVVGVLAALATGLVRLARITARGIPIEHGTWRSIATELTRTAGLDRHVEILQSAEPSLLVTCGVLQPKIVLPAGVASWTVERQRVVLAHELAHVRRGDGVVQLGAEVIRALHWFNPVVALACRRLRQESEQACDDAVLNAGIDATEYATHLLGVARHLGRGPVWASAPAIAHPSNLERRIASMLNNNRDRRPISLGTLARTVAAAVLLVAPLTALSLTPATDSRVVADRTPAQPLLQATGSATTPAALAPQLGAQRPVAPLRTSPRPQPLTSSTARAANAVVTQAPAEASGTVLDQTGGAVPGVRLELVGEGGESRSTLTNAAGRFAFRGLPPARYDLRASFPGFATVSTALPLAAGTTADRVITLPLGSAEETISVLCSSRISRAIGHGWNAALGLFFPVLSAEQPAVASPAQQPAPMPVRIGGDVRAPIKLKDVKPTCPSGASGVATTVILAGQIGTDGTVIDIALVPNGSAQTPQPEFVESAMDAVRQWLFRPTLLNGQPTAVDMTVRISYDVR